MENSFYKRLVTLTRDSKLGVNHKNVFSLSSSLLFIKSFESYDELKESNLIIDIIIVDLDTLDSLIVKSIRQRFAETKIVCVSNNEDLLQQILPYNIHGFISERDNYSALLQCLSQVSEDLRFVDQGSLEILLSQNVISFESDLTNREQEVLAELANSLSYEQIAYKLTVSKMTIKKHLEHIYSKLNVKNRYMAVEKARNEQII